mgnify:CR=1 FL=1
MEIVTNKYLKRITLQPVEELYDEFVFESPEVIQVDKEVERKALSEGFNFIIRNKERLQELYSKFDSDVEKDVVLKFASFNYYLTIYNKSSLIKQRRHCRNLLKSDVCKRNIILLNELIMEEEKLSIAIETKHDDIRCTYLNNLYKEIYPDLEETDRYIRISEIMNVFNDSCNHEFFTIDGAKKYIKKRTQYKSERKYIYDRIKDRILE